MSDEFYTPGWVDEPQSVELVALEQPMPFWGLTPAAAVPMESLPTEVFLWQSWEKVRNNPFPNRSQGKVGSCVSFGCCTAIEVTACCEILAGEPEESRDLVQEIVYAGSRVEIGNGRFSSDGSIGAWAAEFVRKYGVLDRGLHGKYDLTSYSEARCREWGAPGRGVPNELEDEIRKFPVRSITLVKSWEGCKQALAQGYAVSVASSQGFRYQRDSSGVCAPSGKWAHQMAILGYAQIGGKDHGFIMNSWGPSAHTGPLGPGKPPVGGFYATADVIGRMLAMGDSWAYSGVQGFPSRRFSWFI